MDKSESLQPDSVVPEAAITHALDGKALFYSLNHSFTHPILHLLTWSLTYLLTHTLIKIFNYLFIH